MITFTARSREEIIQLHTRIADAIEGGNGEDANAALSELQSYTVKMANDVIASRAQK